MPFKVGNNSVSKFYVGSSAATRAFIGSTLVWPEWSEQQVSITDFTGLQTITIDLANGDPSTLEGAYLFEFGDLVSVTEGQIKMQVSTDNVTWITTGYRVNRDMTTVGTDLTTSANNGFDFVTNVPTALPGFHGFGLFVVSHDTGGGTIKSGAFASYLEYGDNAAHAECHGYVDITGYARYVRFIHSAGNFARGTLVLKKLRPAYINQPHGTLLQTVDMTTGGTIAAFNLPLNYEEFHIVIDNFRINSASVEAYLALSDDGNATQEETTSTYGQSRFAASAIHSNFSSKMMTFERVSANAGQAGSRAYFVLQRTKGAVNGGMIGVGVAEGPASGNDAIWAAFAKLSYWTAEPNAGAIKTTATITSGTLYVYGVPFREFTVGEWNLAGKTEIIVALPPGFTEARFEFENVISTTGGDFSLTTSADNVTYQSANYDNYRDMTGGGTDLSQLTTAYAFGRVIPTSAPGYSGVGYLIPEFDFAHASDGGHAWISKLDTGAGLSSFFSGRIRTFTNAIKVRYAKIAIGAGAWSSGKLRVKITRYKQGKIENGTLLSEQIVNGLGTYTFSLPTTYSEFRFEFENVLASAAASDMALQFSDSVGYAVGATDYVASRNMNGGGSTISLVGTDRMPFHRDVAQAGGVNGFVTLQRCGNGMLANNATTDGTIDALGTYYLKPTVLAGQPITAKLFLSANNFAGGKIRLRAIR